MTREEIAKGRQKLINGVWGWLVGATIMLAAAALSWESGFRCMTVVPAFLFFVCMFFVFVSAYGLAMIREQENVLDERESKWRKVVK